MIRKIGIISPVMGKANVYPFSNLIEILTFVHGAIISIVMIDEGLRLADNTSSFFKIVYKTKSNIFSRIIYHLWIQLKLAFRLLMISKDIDLWIFYLGEAFILPMIAARVLGKKTALLIGSRTEKDIEHQNNGTKNLFILIKNLNLRISSWIILYSPNLIISWGLQKYENKILIAGEHYIDLDKFKLIKKFKDRPKRIGYIGRFSEEKGVMNFMKSISLLNSTKNKIDIFLGGDGKLTDRIEEFIRSNRLDAVEMRGWIDHSDLPEYLNTLKLLVLPSYTEGLPNIMLEAMACGTPVLATAVGAIPDLIEDGRTGFIMENNSPDIIAKNIKKALENPNLELISKNCRCFIEDEFSYHNTAKKWRAIIETLNS